MALSAAKADARDFPPGNYVDVHTHLGQTGTRRNRFSADGAAAVDGCQRRCRRPSCCRWSRPSRRAIRSRPISCWPKPQPHRDRLIPFCSVDPRTSYSGGLTRPGRHAQKIRRPRRQGFWRAQAGRADRRSAQHDHLRGLRRTETADAVPSRRSSATSTPPGCRDWKRRSRNIPRRSSSATGRAGGLRSPAT